MLDLRRDSGAGAFDEMRSVEINALEELYSRKSLEKGQKLSIKLDEILCVEIENWHYIWSQEMRT
jgi:hypothetical protein